MKMDGRVRVMLVVSDSELFYSLTSVGILGRYSGRKFGHASCQRVLVGVIECLGCLISSSNIQLGTSHTSPYFHISR